MNKFTLFLFTMCLFTFGLKAQTPVQIGDLYYMLDEENLTAETAPIPMDGENQPRYEMTAFTVPATVDLDGKTYDVVEIGNSTFPFRPILPR
jgi:hypothetical protein